MDVGHVERPPAVSCNKTLRRIETKLVANAVRDAVVDGCNKTLKRIERPKSDTKPLERPFAGCNKTLKRIETDLDFPN